MAITDFTTAPLPDVAQVHTDHPQDALPADDAGAAVLAGSQGAHAERATPNQFKPRQLRVSYLNLTHDRAPFLRLGGNWLNEAGFHIGRDVQVTVASECLVIRPGSPTDKTKEQIREERRAALRESAYNSLGTLPAASRTLGTVAMVCEAAGSDLPTSLSSQDAPVERVASNASYAPRPEKVRGLRAIRGTWPERIGTTLKVALGDVLSYERARLTLHPSTIAEHAQVRDSRYRAFDRGKSQPNLSTFIALAWTLDQDPRDLFDKLLLQMGLPRDTRPVLLPRRS